MPIGYSGKIKNALIIYVVLYMPKSYLHSFM